MARDDVVALVVLFLLLSGKSKGKGGGALPVSSGNQVPQVGTGGSSWVSTRYAAAFDAVGKLLPQIDASDLHEIAVSVVALWALETAYGKAEWNYNVGNVMNVGSQPYFVNAGDGNSYAAYPTLADAVDAWATLLRSSRYQNAAVQLIENPTSDAWVTLMGQAGYYTAPVLTYVKAYDGARLNVAQLLASAAPANAKAPSGGTGAKAPSGGGAKVIPIRGKNPHTMQEPSTAQQQAAQEAKQLGVLHQGNQGTTPTGAPLSASGQRWDTQGILAGAKLKSWGSNAAVIMSTRTPVTGQPSDMNAFCNQWGLSPVFAYPELPWSWNGDTATATYNLGPNDSVTWTAQSNGTWSYSHTTAGFLQQAANTLASDLQQLVNDLGVALPLAADLTGFLFVGMFLHLAEALIKGQSLSDLGQALAQDWNVSSNAAQMAFNIVDGDWGKAWDHVTQYGQNLDALRQAFYPGAAPDRNGKLTISQSSVKDFADESSSVSGGRRRRLRRY